MCWTVLDVPVHMQLLIGDVPVLRTEQGLAAPQGAVVLPISSRMALRATNEPRPWFTRRPIRNTELRDINRTTIAQARRYIFFLHKEKWIAKYLRELRGVPAA